MILSDIYNKEKNGIIQKSEKVIYSSLLSTGSINAKSLALHVKVPTAGLCQAPQSHLLSVLP